MRRWTDTGRCGLWSLEIGIHMARDCHCWRWVSLYRYELKAKSLTCRVEILLLLGMSVVYMTYRGRSPVPYAKSPISATFQRPSSPANVPGVYSSSVRERNTRMSHSHGLPGGSTMSREDFRKNSSPLGLGDEQMMVGAKGSVWGTEGREYR